MKRLSILMVAAMVAMGPWSAPARAANVLFVGDLAGSGTLPKHDQDDAMVAHLEDDLGHTVTRVSGSGSSAADAEFQDLVIISESIVSSSVGAKFKDVEVGCLIMEVFVYDDMQMTTAQGWATDVTDVTIVDETHPLAAGFSAGSVTVYDPAYSAGVGTPTGSAAIVAQVGTDNVLFAYEEADSMVGMNAPARRTGFFLPAELNPFENNLTADGLALFDAAVEWTSSAPPPPPPEKATEPDPPDLATAVTRTHDLSWTAGARATSRDVYFGTSNPPGAPEFQGNQTATTFDPGVLDPATTYYWRIDEKNSGGTTTGDVWSFTTNSEDVAGYVLLVGDTASGGSQPWHLADEVIEARLENTLGFEVTRVAAAESSGADAAGKNLVVISESIASTDVADKFRIVPVGVLVLEPNVYDDMDMAGDEGLYGDPTQVTFLVLADDTHPLADGLSAGNVTVYSSPGYMGQGTPNANAAVVATVGDGAAIFGYDTGAEMLNGLIAPARRTGFFLVAADNEPGKLNADGWALFDAAVDWTKLTEPLLPPEKAADPNPPDLAAGVSRTVDPSWTPGLRATSHDVYFGSINPPPFLANQTETTFEPDVLDPGTTYYWRIDEKNWSGTTIGDLWSFTTNSAAVSEALLIGDTAGGGGLPKHAADEVIADRLENTLGCTVTRVSAAAASVLDAVGKDLVIISESVVSDYLGAEFRTIPIGVLVLEAALYGDMDMANNGGVHGDPPILETDLTIVDDTHPLAGGLPAGSVTVYSSPSYMLKGTPNANAATVATIGAGGDIAIFGYEVGATMLNAFIAPARRVGFFLIAEENEPARLTADGWALFDAAVQWTKAPGSAGPPTKATDPDPAHLATQVSRTAYLSWKGGSGAISHDVYFGTVDPPGGPEFQGNQIGTTFDPGDLGANTTYYWQINEVNGAGTTPGDVWSFTTNDKALVLFVGHRASGGSNNKELHDTAIVAYLENDLGLNVKRVSAAGSSTADADDKDLVIISESVASTQVGDKFKAVAVGVLVMEAGLYDDMEMASPAGFSGETTTLTIVDDTHPLAAGLSAGPVTVYDPQYSTAFGTPSGSAAVVAQLGTDPVIFGYEIADTMLNAFTAPERRVGFFLPAEDNPFENNLTANGLALFDAAVNWAGPYIPSPDFDGDTDVDQIDHGIFEDCATGPDVLYDPDNLPAACGLAIEPGRGGIIPPDLDSDGDVDGSDFAIFQGCISGPGVPFDPTCVR